MDKPNTNVSLPFDDEDEQERQLTVAEQQLLAKEGTIVWEPDDLDAYQRDVTREDIIIPIYKLVQGTSRWDGAGRHAGEFYRVNDGIYVPDLRTALLAVRKSRSLFEAGSFDAPKRLCVSDDAIRPRQQVEVEGHLTGPECATCFFAQWGSGGGNSQACKMTHNLLDYDLEEQTPFILRVGGTSILPWRRHLSAAVTGKRRPAYAQELLIGSKEETFDAGKAHVMTFRNGEPLAEEVAAITRQAAMEHRNVTVYAEDAEDGEIL